MSIPSNRRLATLVGALGVLLATTPAHAVPLTFNGVTYTIEEQTTADPLTNEFALKITGINSPADNASPDGGGRSGVNAFALTPPTNFVSATMISPPTGFTLAGNGLNSSGCQTNSANFFCFDNSAIDDSNSATFGPVLAANSSLTFLFDVTISSGTFSSYTDPSFKIDWVGFNSDGTPKHNYDLVSMEDMISPGCPDCTTGGHQGDVPEPASLAALGTALVSFVGLVAARRRRWL